VTHLSPGIRNVEPYPFEELDRRKASALAEGRELIDFGVGDPREVTPPFIRDALQQAVEPISSYPRAAGLPELRRAIAGWIGRRFDATIDSDTQVLPILGSKELVFSLAQAVLDPGSGKDLVLVTAPGYTIPERGARYAGGEVVRLPLTEDRGFLPDLDGIVDGSWDRAGVLWLNYPNNPTGAVAPLGFLREAAERCRSHDVLLASDEAYSELWFEPNGPPPGVLQLGDVSNVLAINTLSKRSSMTGYRSGFAAGDPEVIGALKRLRPSVGVTPQEFVQRASVAAWNDEAHVVENRQRYAAKRRILLALFERHGVEVAGSQATFYLWVKVPGGGPSLAWAMELLEAGVIVAPGSFFGPEGEGYVRMAMVPTVEDCERAASALGTLFEGVTA
jgi:succinyldiaminopimelate transaminase